MFAASFDYHRPKTVQEAMKLLKDVKGSRILAGGHSLIPAMKLRMSSPSALIDISRIAELRGIKAAKDGLVIGAMTTHAEIASSDLVRKVCPILATTAGNIGDQQVRNRGTIGGSLAHADPGADYPTIMLLLEAKINEIAAEDFFVDLFTTSLKAGEILTSIHVPAASKAVYLKHRHPASAFAVVGVAAMVQGKEARIAIGGATAVPVRAKAAEKVMRDSANIEKAAAAIVLNDPLTDTYASGEYRVHLAKVMTKRALLQL